MICIRSLFWAEKQPAIAQECAGAAEHTEVREQPALTNSLKISIVRRPSVQN